MMNVTVTDFGCLLDNRNVDLYTVENSSGASISFINLGAIIVSVNVPDKNGKMDDVVLGFDKPAPYLTESPYFGAVVGRYANRIKEGKFSLKGKNYQLATNNGVNHLHGGDIGFDKLLWQGRAIKTDRGAGVRFSSLSSDGNEGYPGDLFITVTYIFTENNALEIDYQALAKDDTILNISQHSYFNLAGQGSPTILNHFLQINAEFYTPIDSTLIPTGEILAVADTPFDFSKAKPIGKDIKNNNHQIQYGGGYDHNWVLRRLESDRQIHSAAVLTEPSSGRKMEIFTDQPGLQFYSGNFLDGTITGKKDKKYAYRSALALETQHYPDSPNNPHFPRTTLEAGESFKSRTIYQFGVIK